MAATLANKIWAYN